MQTKRVAAATIGVGVAVALVAGALAAWRAPAAELSAAEIVARNVTARGGLDAWRKVETMVWMGHIESAHTPSPSMPFTLEQKRPNKTRLQIDALGLKSVRVFDGVRGWKAPPTRGHPDTQPYTVQELRFAQAGHGIDGPLIDLAARGSSVTLEGVEELGSRKAFHLKVRLAQGGTEDVWVDAATYLDVRYDRIVDGPPAGGEPRRVSVIFGDYRTVEGLQIPFLIQTGGGPGATPDRMRVERVALNAPLDDATFRNPASPRPRPRARWGAAPQATAPTASTAPTGAGAANDGRGPVPP
jgi:hypothetical protein